jgi:hypothetical protein
MNFAENQKWPTSRFWRGGLRNTLGGYIRGDSVPARVHGAPQGRLLDKRPGEGVVFISVGLLGKSALDRFLSVWLGVCLGGV